MSRTEEQILARLLVLHVKGEEKELRVLSIAEERRWKATLTATVAGISDIDLDLTNMEQLVSSITSVAGDRILDLVLAYDVDKVLGEPAWLEANATSEEVYQAFKQILEVVAPFVHDAQAAMTYVQTMQRAAQSALENSTNTRLPTGGSVRKRSKVA